jgi:hypothetical protein
MKITIKMLAILMVCSGMLATVACNKDDDDDNKSTEELLTAPSCWKLVKSEGFDPSTNTWVEEALENCDKDDCQKFNSDKSISFDEGATKCDPSDPQSYTGTWSLSADNKQLTLTALGLSFPQTIVEINSGKLVLEADFFGFKSRSTLQP